MTPTEFRSRVLALERQIDQNKRIKCPLVAARYQRQLDRLRRDYEELSQPSKQEIR